MRKVKYNFEYYCSSIWIEEEGVENPIMKNIVVDNLAISLPLKKEIKELEEIYQSTFNQEDGRESEFKTWQEFSIFANRVIYSSELLKTELNNRFEIIFNQDYWEDVIKISKIKIAESLT